MGIKKRVSKFAHPALLILVLCVVYAVTVGRYPHGGPIEADLEVDGPTVMVNGSTVPSLPFQANEPEETIDVAVDVSEEDTLVVAQISEVPAVQAVSDVQSIPQPQPQPEPEPEPEPLPAPIVRASNVGGPTPEDMDQMATPPRPQVFTHTVRLGETLTDIARAYNIDVDTIIAANSIPDPNRIRSGDQLAVPNVKGVLHEVKRGESLWNIANFYDVTIDEIVAANDLANPNSLRVGQQLVVPGAQALVALQQREAIVSPSGQLLRNFSWPATGRISSRFGPRWGRFHYGLDLAVPTGTPVRAAAAGRVTYSAEQGSYGLLVKIDHGHGVETRYAHNSRLVARVGQRVARGEIIAYSGNTGNSTGPHLHFEIRRNGSALDPLDFLR